MKILFTLALLLIAVPAFAQQGVVIKQSQCTMTADLVQTNADGSNLADLAGVGFYVAPTTTALAALATPTFTWSSPNLDPPTGATAVQPCSSLPPGQYFAQWDLVDTSGNRSGRSPVVPFVSRDDVPPATPSTALRPGPVVPGP